MNVHDYMRFATEAMVQRGQQAATAAHQRFMQTDDPPGHQARRLSELVQSHLRQGDVVVITSATTTSLSRGRLPRRLV